MAVLGSEEDKNKSESTKSLARDAFVDQEVEEMIRKALDDNEGRTENEEIDSSTLGRQFGFLSTITGAVDSALDAVDSAVDSVYDIIPNIAQDGRCGPIKVAKCGTRVYTIQKFVRKCARRGLSFYRMKKCLKAMKGCYDCLCHFNELTNIREIRKLCRY